MRGGANVFGAWVAFTSMLIWEDVSAGSHEFDWKIMKTTTGANDGAVDVLLPSMIAQYHFASLVVSSNSTSV